MKKLILLTMISLISDSCYCAGNGSFYDVLDYLSDASYPTWESKKAEIKLRILKGVDPNDHINDPIYIASHAGDFDFVKWLINNGAIPNYMGISGFSAISYLKNNEKTEEQQRILDFLISPRSSG